MRNPFLIPPELSGERADKIVATLAGISRQQSRAVFEVGVWVEGMLVAPDDRPQGGTIEFEAPLPAERLQPEFVSFEVRYEDDHLLIIDKPAGVVVHPGAGRERGTLAAGLVDRYPELAVVGDHKRAGLVHRLDKETSGLLLVARSSEVHRRLVSALAAHQIHRRYLTLVHGEMEMPTGTIDAPISRDPLRPTRKKVSPEGRPARTHYRVLWKGDGVSLLEVDLETGRTHQIRVHLGAIGHPVVGDRTYSRRNAEIPLRRMFLHAARLQFQHPVDSTAIDVGSSLPDDLSRALSHLPEATIALTRTRPG